MWKRQLSPQLKSDIWHLAIGGDGKYFDQDDFAITVVNASAQSRLPIRRPTLDRRRLRRRQIRRVWHRVAAVEKWSVADAKPVEVRELVSGAMREQQFHLTGSISLVD